MLWGAEAVRVQERGLLRDSLITLLKARRIDVLERAGAHPLTIFTELIDELERSEQTRNACATMFWEAFRHIPDGPAKDNILQRTVAEAPFLFPKRPTAG